MKVRVALFSCALFALALALPVAAQAGLPRPKTTLIVPNHSLGGVALGASATAVEKAWGPAESCELACIYEGKPRTGESPPLGSALLEKHGNATKVWLVFVEVAEKTVGTKAVPDFNTSLTRFKTAKGIGLGSKLSELKRAYSGLKREPIAGTKEAIYRLKGPREVSTGFTVGAAHRVTTISISTHPGG